MSGVEKVVGLYESDNPPLTICHFTVLAQKLWQKLCYHKQSLAIPNAKNPPVPQSFMHKMPQLEQPYIYLSQCSEDPKEKTKMHNTF